MYSERERELLERYVKKGFDEKVGHKTTVVCLMLNNGYEVVGTSACINPEDYDYELGVFYATKDALLRVKDIAGYLEQQLFAE